jgi:uncharacterized membrane protein YhhN
VTGGALALLVVAGALAVGDWLAVARRSARLEYVCKPGTLAALIGVALVLDPAIPAQRWWFVAALVLSLAGDVFLMLPQDRFVPGLVSFLLAHLAYIPGLWLAMEGVADLAVPAAVVALVAAPVLLRVLRAVRETDATLVLPVAVYATVISVMVATAGATRNPVAIMGAVLFYGSDLTIAWNRFVAERSWARVAIHVTYHLGQAGLVLSLALGGG